jgi:hypothetical protein
VIRVDHDLTTNKPEVVLTLVRQEPVVARDLKRGRELNKDLRGGRVGLKREALPEIPAIGSGPTGGSYTIGLIDGGQ